MGAKLLLLVMLLALTSAYRLPSRATARARLAGTPFAQSCTPSGTAAGEPLLLTPLIKSGNYAAARAQSAIGGTAAGPGLGYSGFISVPSASGRNTNNLFFWYQPCSACNISTSEFIMWMQGGPGAPSSYGALSEIGNFFPKGDCTLGIRCNSWCVHHSCIFIDQPVQTGFSFQTNATGGYDPDNVEYTRTSRDAALQLRNLLDQFFLVFSEVKGAPFWVTGESYGGQYGPNMALVILETNTPANTIPLVGVSIGDPVMNQVYQWPTYATTLYSMGLINLPQRQIIQQIMDTGVQYLRQGNCQAAFNQWNSVWNDDGENPSPFLYQAFSGSNTTYEQLLNVDPPQQDWPIYWLDLPKTQARLHAANTPVNDQAEGGPIYNTMVASGDFCANSTDLFALLLVKYGIHVQIYSSSNDPLLGPPTTEAAINAMMHKAAEIAGSNKIVQQWTSAQRIVWSDPQQLNGYASCFQYAANGARFCYPGNCAFQPRAALDMTQRFIKGVSFAGPGLPLPNCAQCGGSPPFTGSALCECHVD